MDNEEHLGMENDEDFINDSSDDELHNFCCHSL